MSAIYEPENRLHLEPQKNEDGNTTKKYSFYPRLHSPKRTENKTAMLSRIMPHEGKPSSTAEESF